MHPVEQTISLSHHLPVWCFYRSQHFLPDFGINSTQVTIAQKQFSPGATSRKTQKKVAFSKKLHLTRETDLSAAEIVFCYVFQITINSQLADRRFFLWCGVGVENSTKNNRTIIPVTLYLRKASQYFTDTMITTYEATQKRVLFFVVSMEIFAAFAQNLRPFGFNGFYNPAPVGLSCLKGLKDFVIPWIPNLC